MKPLARIARLSAALLASNLTRGAIAFALSLVVGRLVGVERFGRWILCSTWASTLTVVVDLGFGLLLPRDGAESGAPRGRLCGTALVARLLAAIPAAFVMTIVAGHVSSDPETVSGLRIAGLLGVSGAAYGCFGSTFRSQPRWVPAVLIVETTWAVAQLAASWALLRVVAPSGAIVALLAVAVAAQLGQMVSAVILWRFAFADDAIRVPQWPELVRTVARALPFAASGLLANLHTRVAPLMLGYLSTDMALGSFAAAARFATTAKLVPGAIFAGALPVLSREYAEDALAGRAAYLAFHRWTLALAIVMALPCLMMPSLLLRLVYGSAFVGAAPALVWIGLGLVPNLANSAKKIFLYAAGAERLVVAWSAVSLAVQVAAGWGLIARFGSGGAAASLALGELIIWWPLADTVRRIAPPSSRRRARASTPVPPPPAVRDALDPAAAP